MSPKNYVVAAAAATAIALAGCGYNNTRDTTASSAAPSATASIEQQAKLFMDQGAVAAVVQVSWPGGEWSKAWGVRDLDSKAPAQPTDRVPVASVTKTMTAVTVLKMVDDHLVGLDDPVNDVIPGFTAWLHPPGPITVQQLLNHTSGVPEVNDALPQTADFRPLYAQTLTMERGLQLAGTLPWPAAAVGRFAYSNTDYLALGLLVQTFRHKPFAQVVREEVLEPLGMTNTSLSDHLDVHEPGLIHGYVTLHGQRADAADSSFWAGTPAGGATSTVADMNRLMAGIFQGKAVSAESLRAMETSPVSGLPYGLGVWMHSDGCSPGNRYEGRGSFWGYQTIAVTSADGRYQGAMTVAVPPMPTELEDPSADSRRNLLSGQIESALNETLDRLCKSSH
ncbi:serine hydrolase domain-containing protein [Sinomonas gamaensis]|uniref:serine hydrolase domain-containing protein n=1 Tax=Sinomonas gamaensis TaxID=2565624 RepID=UPI001107B36A|nr:serine hydrolase domain-containing protein [Sinomonas gamaensis]